MATTDDRRVFIDTNILLAATDTSRERHLEAVDFLEAGFRGEWRLFASRQIFREYLVVATRPVEANGLGLSSEHVCQNARRFQNLVQTLPDNHESTGHLLTLVPACLARRLATKFVIYAG